MSRTNPSWYFGVLALALVSAGLRVLTWSAPPSHILDEAEIQAGKMLFVHDWKPGDPLSPGGDGLGPVFNATSCVACHSQAGLGGAGGMEHNVTMFSLLPTTRGGATREGVVHAHATKPAFQETLAIVHPALPAESQPRLLKLESSRFPNSIVGFNFEIPPEVRLSQRNTPALFGAKLIDEIPDRVIFAQEKKQRLGQGLAPAGGENLPIGRALRLADGRAGRFGWKAQSSNLFDFVQAACAYELGLGNPGQAQPKPLGQPDYQPAGLDLTTEQCRQMTTFIASLPRPVETTPLGPDERDQAERGKALFHRIGCADCHTPNLGSIEGIYSDLLLHRMGEDLQGSGFHYGQPTRVKKRSTPSSEPIEGGPLADEWRTPPLWGVADSAPYLHDGRAETLEVAIFMHKGQSARTARAFSRMSEPDRNRLILFLKTLRAPNQ